MCRVESGDLKLTDATVLLGISYRQAKRVRSRYKKEGDRGLVHRSRGRRSNRGYTPEAKNQALCLYQEMYAGYGPTLYAEQLQESHGMEIDHETLRRWLLEKGLRQKVRRKPKHRKRRERKEHFGEMVQMDGSHHDWFSGNGRKCCLMVMVDDATGHTMVLMSEEETTEAAMRLLRAWIERHGVPCALYTDRKNVYVTEREPTLEEELSGQEPLSVFGKACKKLGIRIIPAYSPQAKGRVERKNGVFQDRWVKKLALKGITDIETANEELPSFTEKLNSKFCVSPASPEDYHSALPEGIDLDDVLCWEETRTLNNDWTVRYENRWFQILAQSPLPPARGKVTIRKRLDGSLHILYRGRNVAFEELPTRPAQETEVTIKPRKKWKPAPDHPWRNGLKTHRGTDHHEQDEIPMESGAARGTVPLALAP
ncbi:ISNCY family transposase [Candidatus Bathyarchaeota archaeon]|nr:ISNCY family transposase [Candidatus Bathyarchaeota archaeon]